MPRSTPKTTYVLVLSDGETWEELPLDPDALACVYAIPTTAYATFNQKGGNYIEDLVEDAEGKTPPGVRVLSLAGVVAFYLEHHPRPPRRRAKKPAAR